MEINEIKLIMISTYEKQFNNLFNKFNMDELDLKGLIYNINLLNRRYNCIRIDVKNFGNFSNDLQFFEYGKYIYVDNPGWFKNEFGIGYQLEGCHGDFEFIFKCINSGNLKIFVRGVDFRDIDNFRIPIYINFNNLTINDENVFNKNHIVWHDEPYVYEKTCQNQQYFAINLKFKTLFNYFPSLNFQLSEDISKEELLVFFNKVNKYIFRIIYLLKKKII